MKINKCYDYHCRKVSCFVECKNMLTNILLLKNIHDKINRHSLDKETDNIIYDLNNHFQNNFIGLCSDYITEYERIIGDKYPEYAGIETEKKQ